MHDILLVGFRPTRQSTSMIEHLVAQEGIVMMIMRTWIMGVH